MVESPPGACSKVTVTWQTVPWSSPSNDRNEQVLSQGLSQLTYARESLGVERVRGAIRPEGKKGRFLLFRLCVFVLCVPLLSRDH